MRRPSPTVILVSAVLLGSAPAAAQGFENNTTQIPLGKPGNKSSTENLDFADVDLDGDFDVVFADGGNSGTDRNRIWINQGGLQGGTIGYFLDDTSARIPAGQDRSRDLDFVDIDQDGDADLYVTNTSAGNNQTNRWWVNQGGAQGGAAGFFVDETLTRWVNLGVNDGATTFSSLSPTLLLPSGGFVDWSCDCTFGDLDADGDMDLVHTSYGTLFNGKSPTRLFLNDGNGAYEEHNPSGFQLPFAEIQNGDPALWAEGIQMQETTSIDGAESDIAGTPLGVEVGDLDGDLDIDILNGDRNNSPRMFMNQMTENGGVFSTFRDTTSVSLTEVSTTSTHYEQELGDFDADDDLDIYGLSWGLPALTDILQPNSGAGLFNTFTELPGPDEDDSEPDFFDYDGDGDLDIFVANWVGQDRLFENQGPPGYQMSNVTGPQLPASTSTGQGGDCCDVDGDGDYDVFVANDEHKPNVFLKNILPSAADVTAPRLAHLEQVLDRASSPEPTRVRVHVYDNSSWNIAQFNDTDLEYRVDGGSFQTSDMSFSGGQLFLGWIPGELAGAIEYRVRSTDEHGNVGLSSLQSYVATCGGSAVAYCTAGTSASGCQATLSASGTASATLSSGFIVTAAGMEGAKDGLFFFGQNGRQSNPWGNGTSLQCVVPPVRRAGLQTASGTPGACDGAVSQDLNARWCPSCPKPHHAPASGLPLQLQFWYRDPLNTSSMTTSLSDALEVGVCP